MAVSKVLVLGAGISGCMAAAALGQRGVEVDLVEVVPRWRPIGHGITIQGNALRAFEEIGVVEEVMAQGYPFNALNMRRADGELITTVTTARTGGPHLPSTVGSLRSSLLKILSGAALAAGARLTLELTAAEFSDVPGGVAVTFTNGARKAYDLVVGADGINSATRAMIGIPARPQPTGMSIWRIAAPRPESMDRAEVYYGGPRFKAGYSPISADQCYAYMLDDPLDPRTLAGRNLGRALYERSEGYGGTWGRIREGIGADTEVNHQWIEWLLVEEPWHRGRVVIIGDAAHACPPLIAQGAAMCAEDAVVLAEMATGEGELEEVLTAFSARRMYRVRHVVEASLRLVDWEIHPDTPGADPAGLMKAALEPLVEAP